MAASELSHVRYFIDASVSTAIRSKLEDLLQAQGASPCAGVAPSSPTPTPEASTSRASICSKFDVEDVTHIITTTPTFLDYRTVEAYNEHAQKQAARARREASTAPSASGRRGELIATVTPRWLTRTFDLKKRQEEQFFSPDPRKIFSGVVVCTEDLPEGDSETIKGIVAAHGGQWRQPLMTDVTHLVCTKPSGKKYERLMLSGWKLNMRAILPHWFDDCIRLMQRVPEDAYLFPEPPCLRNTLKDNNPYAERLQRHLQLDAAPVLSRLATNVLDNASALDGTKAYLTANAKKHANESHDPTPGILQGRKIYFVSACDLTKDRIGMYRHQIREAGGALLEGNTRDERRAALEKADYVIANYRHGWEFWLAYELGKEIGNVDWLIYTVFASRADWQDPESSATLTSPLDRMLHYPWPREPPHTFRHYIITISGYSGAVRESLKKLINLMGAQFEGNMTKGKTTHVVASVPTGAKVEHAKQWDIPVVNHLWVEDCFLSWSAKMPAKLEYVNYREGPNAYSMENLVGSRSIAPGIIADWASRPDVNEERERSLSELDAPLPAMVSEPNGLDADAAPPPDAVAQEVEDETQATPPPPAHCLHGDTQTTSSPTKSVSRIQSSAAKGVPTPKGARKTSTLNRPRPPPPPSSSDSTASPDSDVEPIDTTAVQPDSSSAQRAEEEQAVQEALIEKTRPRAAPKRKASFHEDEPNTPQAVPSARPRLPAPSSSSTIASDPAVPPRATVRPVKKRKSDVESLESNWGTGTPRLSSGRKAAATAAHKLRNEIMPDVIAFAKEQSGGGKKRLEEMFGGRDLERERSSERSKVLRKSTLSSSTSKINGRSAPQTSTEEDGDDSDDPASDLPDAVPRAQVQRNGSQRMRGQATGTPNVASRPTGRSRVSDLKADIPTYQSSMSFDAPPGKRHTPVMPKSKVVAAGKQVIIASTGINVNDGLRRALIKMGARMQDETSNGCSHVLTKAVSRTVKFLVGISSGAYFVSEQWAIDSVNHAQFLDETPYMLKDRAGEEKHGFSLAESLVRARRSKLFEDQIFYMTTKVTPSFKALRDIAEAGGAKVHKKNPTLKQVQDQADIKVISSLEDKAQWRQLRMNGIPIYSGEAIIKSTLKQELSFDDYELDEDAE